jgi:phage tail-like protein
MATGVITDPYVNFNFLVEIDGIRRAAFQECNGFDSSVEVIEHNEGGSITARKIPGMTKFSNIVLKWGMTDDQDLYNWHRRVATGATERKNGSIVLLDRTGAEVARWNFVRAWPSKWDGPNFTAEGNDVAIETLELAVEGLSRA